MSASNCVLVEQEQLRHVGASCRQRPQAANVATMAPPDKAEGIDISEVEDKDENEDQSARDVSYHVAVDGVIRSPSSSVRTLIEQ